MNSSQTVIVSLYEVIGKGTVLIRLHVPAGNSLKIWKSPLKLGAGKFQFKIASPFPGLSNSKNIFAKVSECLLVFPLHPDKVDTKNPSSIDTPPAMVYVFVLISGTTA